MKRISFAAALAVLLSSPALAYVPYSSPNSVEVNLDILDEMGAAQPVEPEAQSAALPPAVMTPQPVERAPLSPEPDDSADNTPAVPDSELLGRVLKPPLAVSPPPVAEIPPPMVKPRPAQPRAPVAAQVKKPRPPAVAALRPVAPPRAVLKPSPPAEAALPQEFIEPIDVMRAAARDDAPAPKGEATPPAQPELSLAFTGDDGDVADPGIQQKLAAFAAQVKDRTGPRLQVLAYATGAEGNALSARRISLSRALAVRGFLMDHGVPAARIDVRALGAETAEPRKDRVDLVFAR